MRVNQTIVAVLLSVQLVGCTFASAETSVRPVAKPGWARLKPGDRVRITAPGVLSPTGGVTFVAVRTDSLTVQRDLITWRVPIAAVTKLEVSVGRKSNASVGALVGVVIGAVGGAMVGAADCAGSFVAPEGCAVAGGVLFGAGGALLGAVVGAFTKTDKWGEVPLDQLRVSFAPQRDGRFAFGLSVAF